MASRPWLQSYPAGVPAEIDADRYRSIVDLFREACARFSHRPCFTNMGVTLSFADLDRLSGHFAAFLRHDLGLHKGDRIGLQMPNVLQYPVALFGALRAGLVVVNTNPVYTPREMERQYRDAGVKAIVILANFARSLQQVLPKLANAAGGGGSPRVLVTQLGDLFPVPKRWLVNAALRYVKKLVPAYDIPDAIPFRSALASGARHGGGASEVDVELDSRDLAFLQYTGGTTGVAKGAMLSHRNIVANVQQCRAWLAPRLTEGAESIVTPLPLYHIFSLTVNALLFMSMGAENILVANPRDFRALSRLLRTRRFTVMSAVSTLLNGLMNQADFSEIDFSSVKFTIAGAMALQGSVAARWQKLTRSSVVEGYGLTEASPVVSCNPVDGKDRLGTIGMPFPSTEVRLVDDDGQDVASGARGELLVQGPQVMQGYWNCAEETDLVLRDGWLRTGDIAEIDSDGFLRIVDRKKDMILVSGFNVYPNEVEEIVSQHPGVAEVGAIGVPDERSGEIVKIVVVKREPNLTPDELIEFCRSRLAGYKVPKRVEFRTELPKSNVGKVLRRELQ